MSRSWTDGQAPDRTDAYPAPWIVPGTLDHARHLLVFNDHWSERRFVRYGTKTVLDRLKRVTAQVRSRFQPLIR